MIKLIGICLIVLAMLSSVVNNGTNWLSLLIFIIGAIMWLFWEVKNEKE